MARARNIKPGFFANEELVELGFATRLLFIGLWTLADRAGRMEDRPKRIKMSIFPADDVDVDSALNELQKAGFLLRYEHETAKYIQILAFDKHQHPHRDEKPSTIPSPCQQPASTVQAPCKHPANTPDTLLPDSLIPDTPTTAKAGAVSAVDLSIEMRKAGINSQPADPRLVTLASQGVTTATVAAACAQARTSKPSGQIALGYVVAILQRWADEAAAMRASGAVDPKSPKHFIAKPILPVEQQVPSLAPVAKGRRPDGLGSLSSLLTSNGRG